MIRVACVKCWWGGKFSMSVNEAAERLGLRITDRTPRMVEVTFPDGSTEMLYHGELIALATVLQNDSGVRGWEPNTNKQQPHTTNDLHTHAPNQQHPTTNEPSSRRSIR